jgi:hypothetical protein
MTDSYWHQLHAVTYATATNTTPVLGGGKGFSVGTRITDYNGKEYVFVQANSAIAAFDIVTIPSDTFVACGIFHDVAAASEIIGVPQYALASGDYGWVQLYGACKVKVLGLARRP